MKIAIPSDLSAFERRVAATPETVKKFITLHAEAVVERGAGEAAGFSDGDYKAAGARIAPDLAQTVAGADLILKVNAPDAESLKAYDKSSVLICQTNAEKQAVRRIANAGLTCFSLEFVPRVSRAQNMDVLSSQMNLAGYKAVIDAAALYDHSLPLMMTAAGTVPAARVLVLGIGVAGLQAIATAKRLGAIVSAFDVRPETKEQAESLGAKFIADASAIALEAAKSDIVVTAAAGLGKKAPVLVTKQMLAQMRKGAIVFDLSIQSGGNVEGAVYNEIIDVNGVKVCAFANEASKLAPEASRLFARNVYNFAALLIDAQTGVLNVDSSDEIARACLTVKNGEIVNPLLKE